MKAAEFALPKLSKILLVMKLVTSANFSIFLTIRRLFERALAYVGTDYLSYPLWDKYIEYEYTQQQWAYLASIYTRILENPNQQLDRYLTSAESRQTNQLCYISHCDANSLVNQITRVSLTPESSYIAKPAASWIDDFLVWMSPEAFGYQIPILIFSTVFNHLCAPTGRLCARTDLYLCYVVVLFVVADLLVAWCYLLASCGAVAAVCLLALQ
ncbi:uncharacterized protein [Spinacia oleracea]|uniref:Uncharacterized protein isoform X2 n=1 Tax=Spinacia oleracea TaxID=3562 RepID=A0ABM3R077_SPIOL|nr:uncharacterized protein LOC110801815 isoform X2 [Spinacia oleracea]